MPREQVNFRRKYPVGGQQNTCDSVAIRRPGAIIAGKTGRIRDFNNPLMKVLCRRDCEMRSSAKREMAGISKRYQEDCKVKKLPILPWE